MPVKLRLVRFAPKPNRDLLNDSANPIDKKSIFHRPAVAAGLPAFSRAESSAPELGHTLLQ
jgi:hypothetical protein